jgi:predicted phage terminase large subunit-like protein
MVNDLYNTDTVNYLVRDKLSCFYELAFDLLSGGQPFLDSWYIGYLAEHLEAFEKKQIQKLDLEMPPRFGKTALCNIAFSTRYLGLHPNRRIISVSYSAELSREIHSMARSLTNTGWFRRAFPEFNIGNSNLFKLDQNETKNTQSIFVTTKGGYRLATSAEGSITGKGGDIIITDDLMDPKQVLSLAESERILNWTRSTLFSRFNNRKEGQWLNIQQRLGDNDFAGTFVDDSWVRVKIPVKARQTKIYSFGDITKVYKKGEFLEPRRYGEKELAEDIRNMGSKAVEAQFFQETEPDNGEVFRKEWFKYYIYLPKMDYYAIYADTAVKEGRDNDFSVFQCWGLIEKNGRKYAYLVDSIRGKWRASVLKNNAKEFWNKWLYNANKVPLIKFAIEDKSSGSGLIQDLEDETNIPVVKLIPDKDKVARANDIVPRMESGQVLFPHQAEFLGPLQKELLLFSTKKNNNKKDQVDTLTYAIKDLLFDIFDDKNRPPDYSGLINEVNAL